MERKEAEVVCVTGASGFIGLELVRQLLLRGYVIHATVQDLKNEQETKHLEALEGAKTRLRLFQMDLLDYTSIFASINGVSGVFHVASPCVLQVHDPQKQLLELAIEGTKNVLKAAKELGVGRVVLTSFFSTIIPNYNWPTDEDSWSDVDYCRRNGLWYSVSKNLAEKAAWEFAKEKDLNMVVVIPGAVFGPILPPTINSNMSVLLRLLQGCTDTLQDFYGGAVHVKDVALAHILVYESTSATGRHLCAESISHFGDFAAKVAEIYPEYKLAKDTQPGMLRNKNPSKKLMDLGLKFIPIEQIIKDSVESLKSEGYIS
ncbi:Tetraketide alpha-pyrone reductase 1 [Camellia lanceoleosa]|uniref:Tetraketide alpha-pyrone reductase 1 n=1 Tax=Camellia lanceoleosa TaxID=1840588 RepID=A0ACC0F260_9ERIC|nr:Tetraketide alpha-pyrone reductase 1 [Camellia lanceoleosa]